jgi:carbamoyltransferase
MFHLGIAYGHNATVAVVADGRLIFCQSEERLCRAKNVTGFPYQTLEHVYTHVCRPDQVASCTLFQSGAAGYLTLKWSGFETKTQTHGLGVEIYRLWRSTDPEALEASAARHVREVRDLAANPNTVIEAHQWFCRRLLQPADKVFYVDHHLSHALSALPFIDADSGRDTLVFTLDGEGDRICASVSTLKDGRLALLSTTPDHLSVGKIYANITEILGFRMLEHEYKVMGLAPYAKPDCFNHLLEQFRALLRIDGDGQWRGNYRGERSLAARLFELCEFQRFDAVAGALQQFTETLTCDWIRHWVEKTGIRSIACAGGVFMNVKANQRVLALDGVERMVVVPSCGDESTAIGCAVHGSRLKEPETPIAPVRHLYLGQSYDDRAVEAVVRDAAVAGHFEISEPPDVPRAVARLLADGAVVARCAGPMEFGARALGNRSILAHPGRVETVAFINAAVKNRDFWMPFAPTVLAEDVDALVQHGARMDSPFMMVSFDATARGRRDLAAALHPADFTLRPQMLNRAVNPEYYAIIAAFRELTGIGAVLNTSFNLHGEPIVGSPLDAIQTMAGSGLRHMLLNRLLLSRPAA